MVANEGGGLFDTEEAANLFAETQLATLDDEESQEVQIIFQGPEQIYLPVEGDTYYSVYDGETTTLETGIMPYLDVMSGIYDWKAANILNSSVFKIKNFGSGTDYKTMKYWNLANCSYNNTEYNCAPTAATNILYYWWKMRGCSRVMSYISGSDDDAKLSNLYDTLYFAMKTTDSGSSPGTIVGNTIDGYKKVLGEPDGKKWNWKPMRSTNYYALKAELLDHCPIHLVLFWESDGGIIQRGVHAVMNFGYAEDTSGHGYLFVMDGGNNYGRFVWPSFYDNMIGYKVYVS